MKKIDIHTHIMADDAAMDRYLEAMDKHNVEAVLVHGLPMEGRGNEAILEAVRAHPDRIFGSAHVDLREPAEQCIDTVRHYASEGFKCVKLFPNVGFDANDECHEPFWQAVEDLGLMCLTHCGWVAPSLGASTRLSSLTASPFHFEIPARRHPGINFIFAHFGGGATYLETVVLISRLANCFADTTPGWGRWVFEQNMPGLTGLDFSKVLLGTDNAWDSYTEQDAWWTDTLRSQGCTDDDITRYFHTNAAGLLNIL